MQTPVCHSRNNSTTFAIYGLHFGHIYDTQCVVARDEEGDSIEAYRYRRAFSSPRREGLVTAEGSSHHRGEKDSSPRRECFVTAERSPHHRGGKDSSLRREEMEGSRFSMGLTVDSRGMFYASRRIHEMHRRQVTTPVRPPGCLHSA